MTADASAATEGARASTAASRRCDGARFLVRAGEASSDDGDADAGDASISSLTGSPVVECRKNDTLRPLRVLRLVDVVAADKSTGATGPFGRLGSGGVSGGVV